MMTAKCRRTRPSSFHRFVPEADYFGWNEVRVSTIEQSFELLGKVAMREPELMKLMETSNLGYANMNQKEAEVFLAQQDAIYRKVIEDAGLRVAPKKA